MAAGHGFAIGVVLVFAALIGTLIPLATLRALVGAALIVRGATMLVRHRHPRGGGMRLTARELTWWSFFMATAHGAGLMALPLVLPASANGLADTARGWHSTHGRAGVIAEPAGPNAAVLATAAHTIGYLAATAVIAAVVYERVGIRLLRSAWINVDLVWALALVVTGLVSLATV